MQRWRLYFNFIALWLNIAGDIETTHFGIKYIYIYIYYLGIYIYIYAYDIFLSNHLIASILYILHIFCQILYNKFLPLYIL